MSQHLLAGMFQMPFSSHECRGDLVTWSEKVCKAFQKIVHESKTVIHTDPICDEIMAIMLVHTTRRFLRSS